MQDLYALADRLKSCGVSTVAMESTGMYFVVSSALLGRVHVPRALGRGALYPKAARIRRWPEKRKVSRLRQFLRRMKAKLGPKTTITATATSSPSSVYILVTRQTEYEESIWAAHDAENRKRLKNKLTRQASSLGLVTIEVPQYRIAPFELRFGAFSRLRNCQPTRIALAITAQAGNVATQLLVCHQQDPLL